jgi:hypothetical protein
MSVQIAFVSSPELRRDAETLIKRVEDGAPEAQTDLMITTISRFADEILQVFFVDLVDLLHLNPLLSKVIHGSVSTIKTTVHGIARTIVHKLDNQQLLPLADYMGGIMLTAPDTSGDPTPYVGFPVSDATQARLHALVDAMRRDDPRQHEAELEVLLNEITDRALEVYMLSPIELLKLGLIVRKGAEGAVAMIRSAIHLVIRKVLPDLDGTQLLAVGNHLSGLVLADGKAYRQAA